MKFTFTPYPEQGFALLTCDPETQASLQTIRQEEPETWGTLQCEAETLEPLTCNSEWDWINPSETGDLTDAPMLGIREESGQVVERYGFMAYALRSFLDDLADNGSSRWEGGK